VKLPSQEDLLGYMLGALDARETERIQKSIDAHPELEPELLAIKASLAPLELIDEPVGPPPGLARRACQAIASSQRLLPSVAGEEFAFAAGSGPSLKMSAAWEDRGGYGRGSWSLTDMMVACAAAAIVGAVLLPAVSLSRFNSRVTACQGNLQCLFHSMISYAEMNDGEFIKIPDSGPLSVAGCFGPMLKDAGLLEDDQMLACAGLTGSEPVSIPTVTQVSAVETIHDTLDMQRRMGGHYGYALGHADNGIYRAPRSMGRANYALLSDSPTTSHGYTRSSRNHGSSGQNVLFEGGRVSFVTSPIIGTDEVFLNDLGMVAPGVHNLDSVVAPSYIHPVKLVWQ
jgi:hypothetical protein